MDCLSIALASLITFFGGCVVIVYWLERRELKRLRKGIVK